jgi:predicted nucleic acid-binding protein
MKIAVTDANVFIYLVRLDLFDSFLFLGFEIHTTVFIINEYNKGIQKHTCPKKLDKFIRSGQINVHDMEYDEIMSFGNFKSELSVPDRSIFIVSKKLNATLLTADKSLRIFSEHNDLQVKGILWIIHELYNKSIIDKIEYIDKLEDLKSLSDRLPVSEIDRRLSKLKEAGYACKKTCKIWNRHFHCN